MLITKVGIYFEKLTERGRSRGQKLIAHKKNWQLFVEILPAILRPTWPQLTQTYFS